MHTKILITLAVVIVAAGIGGGIWWKTRLAANPGPLRTWVDRGIDEANRTRLEAKIDEILQKIGGDRDIKDLNLWLDLGVYRNTLGDLEGARAAFQTATELNTVNHVSWGNLGDTLAEMGDLRGAEAAYRKAINLVALDMYFEKYLRFLETYFPERTDDYERLLQEAVEKRGQQTWLIAKLAAFYEAQGRYAEAKTHLEVLIRLLPNDPSIKQDLERVEQKIVEE